MTLPELALDTDVMVRFGGYRDPDKELHEYEIQTENEVMSYGGWLDMKDDERKVRGPKYKAKPWTIIVVSTGQQYEVVA